MSEFKSYRFGDVEAFQIGAWGTPHTWCVKRAMTTFEARSEIEAIKLALIVESISEQKWHEMGVRALNLCSKREAA